jgi:hypothetical protein
MRTGIEHTIRVRHRIAVQRTLILLLTAVVGAASCSSRPLLANTHGSSEDLAAAVLDAVARRDRQRLEMLALSEQEFRDHVWPDLPAAQPERNLPFSYVWRDLRQKSQLGLTATLEKHGGQRYEVVAVRFEGASTRYLRCEVHRQTVLTVRRSDGVVQDLRLFGSSLEEDGAWKVFSYVLD